MKKTLTTLSLLGSAIIILDTFNAGQALVTFLLAGALPGTSITISASAMLFTYALLAGFAISRLVGVKRNNTLGPEL